MVRKGFHRDVDSYSGFLEADRTTTTGLAGYLKEKGLRELFVCGLATDFCVGWTALDARTTGFEVAVVEDACRAIDLEGSLARAWRDMADAGVRRVSSAHSEDTWLGHSVIAGLFEVGWAIGLKYTEGFTRCGHHLTVLAMIISLWLLGIAMKSLPVGTAYSIWVGVGAVGTVVLGIVLLGEPANAARLISVAMIVAASSGSSSRHRPDNASNPESLRRNSPCGRASHGVNTPGAGSSTDEVQKHEAVEHGKLALVQHRQEEVALAAVRHEVGHRHEAAQDERRPAG